MQALSFELCICVCAQFNGVSARLPLPYEQDEKFAPKTAAINTSVFGANEMFDQDKSSSQTEASAVCVYVLI